MPVLQEKWISEPLSVVQTLFEESTGGGDGGGIGGFEGRVVQYFTAQLQTEVAMRMVPSLNTMPLDRLPNGCLVRYRCMVQDQFDPELYLKVYQATHTQSRDKITQCGMYRDVTDQPPGYEIDLESPRNVTGDRQTLYCVPIPAETPWAKETYSHGSKQSGSHDTGEEGEGGERRMKRKLSEGEEEKELAEEGMDVDQSASGEGAALASKRQRGESVGASTGGDGSASTSTAGSGPDLNFPLPDEKGVPCLVKVYSDAESYTVSSMVEFVGVLSVDPVLAHFEGGEEGTVEAEETATVGVDPLMLETAAERKAHSPPPSLIPRLHCISARRLPHSHPLIPHTLPVPMDKAAYLQLVGDVHSSRQLTLDLLTQHLLGDRLAAEYTLLHLLSSVYGRTELLALGKFSFNLTNCPHLSPSLATTLHSTLQKILPKCFLLPMTLSNMNRWRFSPRKDYSANRLVAGVLQLSEGTEVVVDETVLQPGQLGEEGVKNLTALGNVVQWQKVQYDFQFHTSEFDCNLPVLMLSEGKSIINVDCHLPLSPPISHDTESVISVTSQLSEDQLRRIRLYIGASRMLHYTLTPEVQKSLEEDFVEMRKSDSEMNAETFHHMLGLARLVSLSYGQSELSLEVWQCTKRLEQQRMLRRRK